MLERMSLPVAAQSAESAAAFMSPKLPTLLPLGGGDGVRVGA